MSGDGIYFAGRGGAIMTGDATHGQYRRVVVINESIRKVYRVMALRAVRGGFGVGRRRCFGSGAQRHKITVMARNTIRIDAVVSRHCGWGESVNVVTATAILAGWQVIRIFEQTGSRVARQWQKAADVAAFTTIGY